MAEVMTKLPVKGSRDVAPAAPSGELAGLERLWDEVERILDGFGLRSARRPFSTPLPFDLTLPRFERWAGAPAVDVAKTASAYEITAELPGIAPTDVEVKMTEGMLSISGEKKSEKVRDEEDAYVSERRYGSFYRSFRLPDDIAADKIEARFANGVLSISVPRRKQALLKEEVIPVKAA
ncbi:Hsp20/alpha crystallin family protein [Bosea sp. TND4EK4]|uniref:Hsp20/alpha crystallin family protein n=1 Tax=Bosea sp. TND4EK4 TaxID=1907408 RepID=UPI0009563D38|nr:Hsp20/alpha crystallin family protein [Bosea sp. TND4EK4]SIP88318.1 heat shock protein Hsp20 [Bosea sp. TND4EK4]